MINDIYLPDDLYDRLIHELANIEPDPATGNVEPHQFTEVLGCVGNIWPAEVLNDPHREE